jgi:hypothetical protein
MSTIGSFNLSTPYQAVTKMNSQLYDAQTSTGDAVTTAIINKFAKTATNQISAKANLAAKAALARIKAATTASQAKQQALVDKEIASSPLPSKQPQDVTLSDGTVIKAPPVALAGGARINFSNGTMTRSDGVIINLSTGFPVPKVDTTA